MGITALGANNNAEEFGTVGSASALVDVFTSDKVDENGDGAADVSIAFARAMAFKADDFVL